MMQYRKLGRTGLRVSAVALGTVSLGVDYGIEAHRGFGRPSPGESISLIREASDAGINLFDTAPAYGVAEELLGTALEGKDDRFIATKIAVPKNPDGTPMQGRELRRAIDESLEHSLRALRRDVLDIVQIHNATVDLVARGEIAEALSDAQREGKVRFLGASVYTEAEAIAVIRAGCFDVLQVAYNLLDQRMAQRVFPAAERAGMGILARSAFLKGALTSKAQSLPAELAELRRAAERARDTLVGTWEKLPQMALRFCLSANQVTTALVGARTFQELEHALAAMESGLLPEEVLEPARELALEEERLLNPCHWPVA